MPVQKTKVEDKMTAETEDDQEAPKRRMMTRTPQLEMVNSSKKTELLLGKAQAKEVVAEEVEEEDSAPKQLDHKMIHKIKLQHPQVPLLLLKTIHSLERVLKETTKIESHSRLMVRKMVEIVVETEEEARVVNVEEPKVAVVLLQATPNQLRNELQSWIET